jgi:ABC-type Na+ efflux pump permease subunit
MAEMGRILVALGVALAVIGGIVMLLGRTGMPLGRLPGDFLYRGKNTTLYFPLASSILISIVLSIVLFLVGRMKR